MYHFCNILFMFWIHLGQGCETHLQNEAKIKTLLKRGPISESTLTKVKIPNICSWLQVPTKRVWSHLMFFVALDIIIKD